MPQIEIENFTLCSELETYGKDLLGDGEAATCTYVCLYLKMNLKIYTYKPQGKCDNHSHLVQTIKVICFCDFEENNFIFQKGENFFVILKRKDIILIGKIDIMKKYIDEHIEEFTRVYEIKSVVTDWSKLLNY